MFVLGTLGALVGGQFLPALAGVVLCVLMIRYTYRIYTYQAKSLWFFILF